MGTVHDGQAGAAAADGVRFGIEMLATIVEDLGARSIRVGGGGWAETGKRRYIRKKMPHGDSDLD